MHLFLDANVYLSFYKLSEDDLEELQKLSVTLRSGATTLYLPSQVRDEFSRNRESTIAASLRYLEEIRLPRGFPRLFMNIDGYAELRKALSSFEEQRSSLLEAARGAAVEKKLRADQLLEELFQQARTVDITDDMRNRAKERYDRGNPPGKDASYGDALNWEALLQAVPEGEDLLLVTADTDYVSKLDPTEADEFLRSEWSESLLRTFPLTRPKHC
jgi:hypothetical protein